jgi:hypothetical protein
LQHFGAGTSHFARRLQHLGAGALHFTYRLQYLGAGTFDFAWYLHIFATFWSWNLSFGMLFASCCWLLVVVCYSSCGFWFVFLFLLQLKLL